VGRRLRHPLLLETTDRVFVPLIYVVFVHLLTLRSFHSTCIMSAPAVPSGDGTTVDPDLTRTAPVSTLRAGEESTKRTLTEHSGQANRPDQYIYDHYLHLTTFTWSVTQVPGVLLWYSPIHPRFANPVASYLTAIYNAWSGGQDFQFKIAGTGFHAGSIAFIRLPPNIHPRTVTAPQAFTHFEWSLMDPKAMDPQGFEVMDQRNIQYHYTGAYDETDPSTFGGYLAAYVLMTLNTSATGSQAISVMVLNKMNANFNVAQPMPLSIDLGPVTFASYEAILAPHVVFHTPQDHKAALYLYADPTATVVGRPGLIMVNLNGHAKYPYQALHGTVTERSTAGTGLIRTAWHDEILAPGYASDLLATAQVGAPIGNVGLSVMYVQGTAPATVNGIMAFVASPYTLPIANTGRTNAPTFDLPTLVEDVVVPNANETVLYFYSSFGIDVNPTFSAQSDHMYRTLERLAKSHEWTASDALLFTLIHTPTDLPIGYVKLYFEGFLTTAGTLTALSFRLADYKLSFFGLIPRTGIIPSLTTAMKQARFNVFRAAALEEQVRRLTGKLARGRRDSSSEDEATDDHLPGPSSDGASFVVRREVKFQK